MPSRDYDVTCFRSVTVLSVFSNGRVMLVSMSSALAPPYDVITIIALVSMSGNKSIDNRESENKPKMAMPRNINIVVTGRLTAV